MDNVCDFSEIRHFVRDVFNEWSENRIYFETTVSFSEFLTERLMENFDLIAK